MKRIYTIIAAIAATSPILSATEISADSVSVDTVKVIEGAHRMVLTESLTGMTVTVSGMDNDSLYSYSYHKDFAPDATVATHQHSNNWELALPFSHKAKRTKYPSNSITIGGLAFGGVIASGAPSLMSTNKGKSWEIMLLNALAYQRSFTPNDKLSVGIGIDWKNYRLDDNLRYYQDDNGQITIGTYGEEVSKPSSRIKTFAWLVPVTYKRRLYRNLWLGVGAVLNFNSYASIKTKYSIGDIKYEHFNDNIRQNVVTVDLMTSINYSCYYGLYVKYSPCNVLKSSTGLKFKSLTAGIILRY